MSLLLPLPYKVLGMILENWKCLPYNDAKHYIIELDAIAVFLAQTK